MLVAKISTILCTLATLLLASALADQSQIKAHHLPSIRDDLNRRILSQDLAQQADHRRSAANIADKQTPQTQPAENRLEVAEIRSNDQAWLGKRAPKLSLVDSASEGVSHVERFSAVTRSAAPKVLGVNVYLVIVWLALLYLMYRTGSLI